MRQSRKASSKERIAFAVLDLVNRFGWTNLSLSQIRKAAKIPTQEFHKIVSDKKDLLPLLVRFISDQMAARVERDMRGEARERLFEVIMARFDALQDHRRPILKIVRESRKTLFHPCAFLQAEKEALAQMISLAQLETKRGQYLLLFAGLSFLYVAVFALWMRDETLDMSKTMAGLDRSLKLADKLFEIVAPVVSK